MANGLRKLIKKSRREFTKNSSLTRRFNRFGPRLRVEELEERIAPAITVFGTVGDGGDGNTTVTLDQVGDGFTFTETDLDVWGIALVSSVGTTGTALTTGNVVITLVGNDTAATQVIDSIDFGNSAALTTGDSVAIVFQLNSMGVAGDGLLNVAAGNAIIDGNDSNARGVFGVSVTDGALDEADDATSSTALNAGQSARIDMGTANVSMGGSITTLHVGDLNTFTAASVSTLVSDTAAGLTGDIGAITTTGNVGDLTVDHDMTGAVSIGGQITGAWTIGHDILGAADIVVATGITAAGDITVGNDFAGDLTVTAGGQAGDVTVTAGNLSGARVITAGGLSGNTVVTAGNLSGTTTITAGGMSGNITVTAGNLTGAVAITSGDLSGDIAATAGSVGNVTLSSGSITSTASVSAGTTVGTITAESDFAGDVTAGTTITGIVSTNGDITSDATITAGGTITAISADTDESGTSKGNFAGTVVQSAGNIGSLDFGGNVTNAISSSGSIGAITIDDALQAVITAATGFTGAIAIGDGISAAGGLTATTGGFAGAADIAITAGGMAGEIIATTGNMAGDITVTAGGLSGTVRATTGNITGAINVVDDGVSGTIEAIAGNITGAITIGDADTDDDGTLSGLIQATAGDVGVVTIDDGITATGAILAGDDITGLITITEGGIALGGTSTTGIIRAGSDITGGVTITAGGLAGTIRAVAGNISGVAITITDGGVTSTGEILAGNNISAAVSISDDGLAGSIIADNDLSGLVTITDGIAATGVVQAGNDLGTGGVLVVTGNIAAGATVTAGDDISGNITVSDGDILANITAADTISGNIVATLGAISGTITASTGDLTGDVTAGDGSIAAIVVGDDIDGSAISAEDDITTITVTGGILVGTTITASDTDVDGTGNIGTIIVGDGINATIAAINIGTIRSGGLAGEDINGTITASGDIDLVDAGNGIIEATVTAQTAIPGSPMATFISDGYSFAVWAITGTIPASPTEPTAAAGVSAELIFDGNGGNPTLEINDLAGTTAATSIYITSRADTGAEQLFWDSDVDVYDAPITLTALTASSAITIGTLYVEGSFTDIGGDSDITINNIVVEGGVGGTISVAVGEDIDFGWVQTSLTVNVAGGGKAGDLILKSSSNVANSATAYAVNAGATVSVVGSLTNVYLGDSSAGYVGDLGTSAGIATLTATGSIDDIFIDGDVLGNIRATSIGDIEVDGNVGNCDDGDVDLVVDDGVAASIDITASTGSIGDVKVDGVIGGDTDGSTVTIQAMAAAGNIGAVNATGNIGTIAVAGNTVANSVTIAAGGSITKVESTANIGDFDTDGVGADVNTLVIITATNGTIGSVTAGGSIGIDANITAGSNIGTVSATHQSASSGQIGGTITSLEGNIGSVNTVEATISATIKATNGDIDQVAVLDSLDDAGFEVDTGNVTGNITAGGDIDLVAGADITGIITAGAATTASPVTQFVYGNYGGSGNSVLFELNATAGPTYGYVLDADNQLIDITIDNWGTAALATGAIDLSLTTVVINDPEGDNSEPYAAAFSLNSLDFTPESIANSADVLGTVTVEGNINVLDTGTLTALIAEGNVQGPIVVEDSATSPVTAFAAGSVTAVDDPTLAQMEAVFEDLAGNPITFGAPVNGTVFALPVSSSLDVSFAFGTASGLAGVNGHPLVLNATTVESFLVTVSGGAITGITGTVNDSGMVYIDGDLAWAITAENLSSVLITGNLTSAGSIFSNNIGSITIGRTITDYIDENGAFADTAAAQAWLDANGNFAGTITSQDVLDSSLDGNISNITIYGNYTGDITADGNVGNVYIGQAYYGVDGTRLATTGNMTGTLSVGGNSGYITSYLDMVGAADSFICVAGNVVSAIESYYGDIGGSGAIMIGGDIEYFWADMGVIAADIFVGGTEDTWVDFGGTAVTGNLVIGAVDGVDGIDFYLYENNDEEDDYIYFELYDNEEDGAMLIEINAGEVTKAGIDVARITMFGTYEFDLYTYCYANAEINIDEIFLIDTDENGYVNLYVYMENGDIGTIVASQTNAQSTTSLGEQAAFLARYNTANGTSLNCDVLTNTPALSNLPSWLDTSLKSDEDNIDLNLYLYGLDNLTGGVIAEGDLYVTLGQDVGVNTFGYMLSLHGEVEADIYANDSIGSIAASSSIDVCLESEGVVAVPGIADGSDMQTAVALYGLSGLPAWFTTGGIMSEIGDIDVDVIADGNQTLVAGLIPVSSSPYVMGTIYAMIGDVEGTLTIGGNFGGIVAPLDTDLTDVSLYMPNYARIDLLVAPYAYDNGPSGNNPSAQLELLWGEILVTEATSPYESGYDTVTVDGAGVIVYLDGEDVYVLTGMNDAAAQVTIEGDIDDLTVETDWAGVIRVLPNADGDLGEIGSGWVTVNGDIYAATADLVAFNFEGYTHNGDVIGTSPVDAYQFVKDGVLDHDTRSISWTNLAGDAQTLAVNASRSMHVRYDTFFGKLTSVEITGTGVADLVSVNGTYDASDRDDARALRNIAKQATRSGLEIFGADGTAHLGSLTTNNAWGKAKLRNVLIDGYNENVTVDGTVQGLRITGDADWIEVSRAINNAFIGVHNDVEYVQSDRLTNVSIFGSVDCFDAIRANRVYIWGSVEDMSGQNWTRVAVDGTVENLWMFAGTSQGRLVDSRFGHVNHENIDNRKWLETSETANGGSGGSGIGGDAGDDGAGGAGVGGDGGDGYVGPVLRNINPYYNPVKIVRTIAPGLFPYSSEELPYEYEP